MPQTLRTYQNTFKEMNDKEKLILQVLNESKESLEKTKLDHEEMMKDFKENGYGDVHTNNIESIKTGLSYTHGYCIGHLELLKKINSLINMSEDEIKELIKENEEIAAQNKKHMDEVLKEIKNKLKDNE